MRRMLLVAMCLLWLGASHARADFVNGSFETGSFGPNWTNSVQTSIVGTQGIVTPTQGTRQARLVTNGGLSLSQLSTFLGVTTTTISGLAAPGSGSVNNGSAIKQTISANAGDTLTFNWNFLTNENLQVGGPFWNDFSFVTIVSGTSTLLANVYNPPLSAAATGTGFNVMTGYNTFTYTFTSSGIFTVGVGVVDVGDGGIQSGLFVDNFSVVPVPAGTIMASCGIISLILLRRFFKKNTVPQLA